MARATREYDTGRNRQFILGGNMFEVINAGEVKVNSRKDLDSFLSSLNLAKTPARTNEEIELYHKEREEREWREKQSNCGMDSDYYEAKIDSNLFTQEQKKILTDYCESVRNGKGDFLIILGDVGRGKTYSACAIINELRKGTYLDMPELSLKVNTADRFNSPINREMLLHDLAKKSLLVLDEIGRYENKKNEEQDILFYILNRRYANNRPTVLCSNLDKKGFADYIGTALTDRLKGKNIKLILEGESKRG